MFNLRAINIIISSLGRNINSKSTLNICRFSRFCLSNKRILTNGCKQMHTNVCLLSSEAAAEKKENGNQTSTDQCDELDSKIGKYIELASDSEQKKKILMILMEHEVAKLEGKRVPSKLSIQDMKELLYMYSYSSRIKYMSFLYEKELRKSAELRKREFKKKEREAWLIEKENLKPPEHIQYGIGHNTMVLRVRKKSVYRVCNQRMANAVLYDQKIVLDMDYDCFMRKQDCTNCGEQLLELYSANRKNRQPYDLHFCNVDLSSTTMMALQRFMPNLYSPDNFITLSELNYLDLFPKEKLVYITPYAKEPLKKYDHSAIYILGGLVDKCIKEPVVLAKAKREGIRAVHLPYDEYLIYFEEAKNNMGDTEAIIQVSFAENYTAIPRRDPESLLISSSNHHFYMLCIVERWGRSNKSLPLNQIMEILLEMKATNDWNKAFRFVPPRKLVRSLDLFSEF